MRQQTRSSKEPVEKVVQDIQRPTRKYYSAINTWGAVSSMASYGGCKNADMDAKWGFR
jgi:hypothetical protein